MKTILVVEDFLHIRNLICKKLESKGYHTLGAASVQEAYDALAHKPAEINLVLSDVDIPDITGFDLLRTIKSNPSLEDIPVAFLTTNYRDEKTAELVRQKPLKDRNFFKEIARAINTKGSMFNLAF